MPDENTPATGDDRNTPTTGDQGDGTTTSPTTTDLGDAGKRALDAERQARRAAEKAAKDAQARLQAIEDEKKSAEQRQAERLARLEIDAKQAQQAMLRLEVAIEKGVPKDLIEFLTGDDRDQIAERADVLLRHVRRAGADGGATPGVLDGGARPPAKSKSLDDEIADATARGDWARLGKLNAQKLAKLAEAQKP